ncbi:uncharacterized protein SAPINGB_P004105 [Magnusiomyces paraingens]|uniref:A1 cistron-splicing factor AAR2 n=1 Tax=Magnusiomyces paraingens TaxID=2606893 RepID=A0A5E8BY74_9ASCO|nr:uncharacterized protein SAPINGB_P004105 [Saprochaete ingens]VVT54497.1 unnamed protein product [Saprochaete ingens]
MGLPPATTIVFVGLPDGISIGLDTFFLQSGPTLHGIRLVGPGVHTLHWSHGGPVDSVARHGVFFIGEDESVVSCRWDANSEEMQVERHVCGQCEDVPTLEALHRYYEGMLEYEQLQQAYGSNTSGGHPRVEELDEHGAAPSDVRFTWSQQTAEIMGEDIARVLPQKSQIGMFSADSMIATTADARELDAQLGHESKEKTGESFEVLNFAEIDLKTAWRPGAIGMQRTLDYLDRSWCLEKVIGTTAGSMRGFVAELELAFAIFVLYGNVSCAAQWRRAVTLLVFSETYATGPHSAAYLGVMEVIERQLRVMPSEYLTEVVGDKYVRGMFGTLVEAVCTGEPPEDRWFSGGPEGARLRSVVEAIVRLLETRYGLEGVDGGEDFSPRDWR